MDRKEFLKKHRQHLGELLSLLSSALLATQRPRAYAQYANARIEAGRWYAKEMMGAMIGEQISDLLVEVTDVHRLYEKLDARKADFDETIGLCIMAIGKLFASQ